jgi:hypothetical protein
MPCSVHFYQNTSNGLNTTMTKSFQLIRCIGFLLLVQLNLFKLNIFGTNLCIAQIENQI